MDEALDAEPAGRHRADTISAAPGSGVAGVGVVRDADRPGRALRVSAHPEQGGSGRVVLSMWQDGTCTSTIRLDRADAVELLGLLGTALLPR